MTRDALLRLADALEDAMIETGRGATARDRELWAALYAEMEAWERGEV